jgi:hypothetical protein
MKIQVEKYFAFIFIIYTTLCSSCSVIEKSSRHGFESGYYKMKSSQNPARKVYLDISDKEVTVYPKNENGMVNSPANIPLSDSVSRLPYPLKLTKTSIDIDITTIPLKFRPSVYNLPAQMDVDFNIALYAGWRHDNYYIHSKENPAKKLKNIVAGRGFDFGFLAGLGSTQISPFTTKNVVNNEYNGMILQFGVAGFLESNLASFGIATGYDYLLSPDRNVWIYNKKPWIGLIIGVAFN